jgi:hypothetical protein
VPEQLGNYRRSISVCPITEAVHGAITDAVKRNPGADVATVEIDVHCGLCEMARPRQCRLAKQTWPAVGRAGSSPHDIGDRVCESWDPATGIEILYFRFNVDGLLQSEI